jgi:hypothetical protein
MTSDGSPRPISPLRARMIEDMTLRGFSEKTRHDCVHKVRAFAAFIGRSQRLHDPLSRSFPPRWRLIERGDNPPDRVARARKRRRSLAPANGWNPTAFSARRI